MKQPSFRPQNIEYIDTRRRTFLTVGVTAVGAFILSRLIDTNQWFRQEKIVQKASFENFDLVETKDEIRLSTSAGEPIFILDKESFRE